MRKFARFYGFSAILMVSNQAELSKLWYETICEKLEERIEHGVSYDFEQERLGYLFDFDSFLNFIIGASGNIVKEPVAKMVGQIEFSEGLASLRIRTGQQLSFLSLLNDYKTLHANYDKGHESKTFKFNDLKS